jgi:hypothetical protein
MTHILSVLSFLELLAIAFTALAIPLCGVFVVIEVIWNAAAAFRTRRRSKHVPKYPRETGARKP